MQHMIEKMALFLLCLIFILLHFDITTGVITLLLVMISSNFSYYTMKGAIAAGIACLCSILVFIFPAIGLFLPITAYDVTAPKLSRVHKSVAFVGIGISLIYLYGEFSLKSFLILVLLTIIGTFMGWKSREIERLHETILRNRDADRELQILLEQKNADLIEKTNYEIEMATLQERNRIAREIHDNVGHLLTRSILQVGALNMINQNETLAPHYEQLSQTLNQAMDTIRASVHDLYNPGLNLRSSIENFIQNISQPEIQLHYDIKEIPQNITRHFIAIIKEGINNTIRHSNADTIKLTLSEHPRFYQLIIEDNGTTDASSVFSNNSTAQMGIGLSSMQERVSSMQGTMEIFTEHGFKIFITVMKKEDF